MILVFFVRKNIFKLLKVVYFFFYCVVFFLVLVVIILVLYVIFLFFVYDFLILVMKVKKWCIKVSYIYLDIILFYVLVRDFGVILGLGIVFIVIRLIFKIRENNWRGF